MLLLVCALPSAIDGVALQSKKKGSPEIFRATARIAGSTANAEAQVVMTIDRYTPEKNLRAMEQALSTGGHAGFVDALRNAPPAGQFQFGDRTFTIKWARKREVPKGQFMTQSITLVIDAPVYFVGAGVPGAKPRAGFDVAVVQLTMDSSGVGSGVMAAAAHVKPGGPMGVEVEHYADEPVKLVLVTRSMS